MKHLFIFLLLFTATASRAQVNGSTIKFLTYGTKQTEEITWSATADLSSQRERDKRLFYECSNGDCSDEPGKVVQHIIMFAYYDCNHKPHKATVKGDHFEIWGPTENTFLTTSDTQTEQSICFLGWDKTLYNVTVKQLFGQ